MAPDEIAWVAVYRSPDEKECRDRALVLQAAGIEHGIGHDEGEVFIWVSSADADRGRGELAAYANENADQPVVRLAVPRRSDGWIGVYGYTAVLLIVGIFAQRHVFDVDWFQVGKTNALLIRQGEWWRTLTALTLHADLAHILSNLIIGGIVGYFAGQSLGAGLAWSGTLAAAAFANFLNACIRPPEHSSIGASTAVFAALGMLAGNAWRKRRTILSSRLERWTPFVAGVVLLSFLGTGGPRTDVGSHVLGFLCGAAAGPVCGKLAEGGASTSQTQFWCGLATLVALAAAWGFALA